MARFRECTAEQRQHFDEAVEQLEAGKVGDSITLGSCLQHQQAANTASDKGADTKPKRRRLYSKGSAAAAEAKTTDTRPDLPENDIAQQKQLLPQNNSPEADGPLVTAHSGRTTGRCTSEPALNGRIHSNPIPKRSYSQVEP